jgi:hypothetical protein
MRKSNWRKEVINEFVQSGNPVVGGAVAGQKVGKFLDKFITPKLNRLPKYKPLPQFQDIKKYEKKLDPVGKEDGDIDNDGDKDSSDSYLMKRRKAIAKAMKKEETEVNEHHQKDADGKVIEHEETTPSSVEEGKKGKGLYANIHAKRKRGESPAKPGDEDYPAKDAFKKAAKTAKKEEVEVDESMKQARKNVGASTCWDGYKAKGTKMKGGKKVPNCVKEFSEWRAITEKK